MELSGKLPHLSDESFQCSCRSRTKDPRDGSGRTWLSSGQQRKRRAHHTESGQQGADSRKLTPATQHPRAFRTGFEPLGGRVNQHQTGDLFGMTSRVSAHDETSKGVANEDATPIGDSTQNSAEVTVWPTKQLTANAENSAAIRYKGAVRPAGKASPGATVAPLGK